MQPPPRDTLADRLAVSRVWHSTLFPNVLALTYHCLALLKRGALHWLDLVQGSAIADS